MSQAKTGHIGAVVQLVWIAALAVFIVVRMSDRSIHLYADETDQFLENGDEIVLYSTDLADTTRLLIATTETAVAFVRTSCASCVEHASEISSIVGQWPAKRALIVVPDGTPDAATQYSNLEGVAAANVRIPADPLALPTLGLRAVPTFFVEDAAGSYGWIGVPSPVELLIERVFRFTRGLGGAG